MARVLVYALGGGLGHAVRGAGIASALREAGVAALAWVRAEAAPHVAAHAGVVHACERPASPAALRAALGDLMTRFEATHLVVDTFPEGILGELQRPAVPAMVVLRARRDGKRREFLRSLDAYERRLDVEPSLGWLEPGSAETSPPAARPLTRKPSQTGALLVASDPRLAAYFHRLRRRLSSRGVVVDMVEGSQAPLTEDALSARVVVGPAGYNLTYELASLGTWHIAMPLARRFDDQPKRARAVAIVCDSPEQLEERVFALARGVEARPRPEVQSHRALADRIARAFGVKEQHAG